MSGCFYVLSKENGVFVCIIEEGFLYLHRGFEQDLVNIIINH